LDTISILRTGATYFGPTRLVIVYLSPMPIIVLPRGEGEVDSSRVKENFMSNSPRDDVDGEKVRGVFFRPFAEVEFEKHVQSLEAC
jgi:hypothetical protein